MKEAPKNKVDSTFLHLSIEILWFYPPQSMSVSYILEIMLISENSEKFYLSHLITRILFLIEISIWYVAYMIKSEKYPE